MQREKITSMINGLFKACERIAGMSNNWYSKNFKEIALIFYKIEKTGKKIEFTRKERVLISEERSIRFYDGKIQAYIYVICRLMRKRNIVIPPKYKELRKWVAGRAFDKGGSF